MSQAARVAHWVPTYTPGLNNGVVVLGAPNANDVIDTGFGGPTGGSAPAVPDPLVVGSIQVTGSTNPSQVRLTGPAGGGGYFLSIGPSNAIMMGGGEYTGSGWTARATSASYINCNTGFVDFGADTSLTVGAAFSPTQRMSLNDTRLAVLINTPSTSPTTGALTVVGGVGIGGRACANYLSAVSPGGHSVGTTASYPQLGCYYTGSLTAGGGFCRGVQYDYKLIASANGDQFDCLRLTPEVAKGSFTGTVYRGLYIAANGGFDYAIQTSGAGKVYIDDITASTSPTTGALTVAGGIGTNTACINYLGVGTAPIGSVMVNVQGPTTVGASNGVNISAGTNNTDMSLQITDTNHIAYHLRVFGNGGVVVGNPTNGPANGIGTINAQAVYDDNALLTCFGVEYAKHGAVDLAQWDKISPTGHHALAHEFAELSNGYDVLDPVDYVRLMLEREALPGMPTRADWQHGKYSAGELINRLWLALELLAVAFATTQAKTSRRE